MPTQTPPKLTITWNDLNSRRVEQRLREQQAMERNRDYADLAKSPHAASVATPPARPSIWLNTIVYMAAFGLLGGLLAWGAGWALDVRPSAQAEARQTITDINEIVRQAHAGRMTPMEVRQAIDDQREWLRGNPYIAFSDGRDPNAPLARLVSPSSQDAWQELVRNVLAYGAAGLMIAACLAAAEPLVSRNWPGAVMSASIGATAGLLGGGLAAFFVDPLYHALGGADGGMTSSRQLLARAAVWAALGLSFSLAPGLLLRSRKKLAVGLLGGLLGGLVGGALYDPLATLTQNPQAGRLAALAAIGLLAGLAAGLIENAAKTGWLRVAAGLIAGKQFILYRNPTYIGSSPDNQIYLFKDPQVGRRHAAIHLVPGGFEIENLPLGAATFINGKPQLRARLHHGDQIRIGTTTFLFQEKTRTIELD